MIGRTNAGGSEIGSDELIYTCYGTRVYMDNNTDGNASVTIPNVPSGIKLAIWASFMGDKSQEVYATHNSVNVPGLFITNSNFVNYVGYNTQPIIINTTTSGPLTVNIRTGSQSPNGTETPIAIVVISLGAV